MRFWNIVGKIFRFFFRIPMGFWNIVGKISRFFIKILMGFWNIVRKIFRLFAGVDKKVSKKELKKQSAIKKGRMRKTDQIKGRGASIPQKPGIYRHVNKDNGKVEYVGQTNNLRVRQQQHARDGKLNTLKQYIYYSVATIGATKDELCNTEKAHIKRKKPSGNKTKGGNGRR